MTDETPFNPFQPQPPAPPATPPIQTASDSLDPTKNGRRKRGPRRTRNPPLEPHHKQTRERKKPGRPRKVGKAPELAAPYQAANGNNAPIDLYKVVAAVAGLDPEESRLVVSMAQSLTSVTPVQAVRIACALGKLFS